TCWATRLKRPSAALDPAGKGHIGPMAPAATELSNSSTVFSGSSSASVGATDSRAPAVPGEPRVMPRAAAAPGSLRRMFSVAQARSGLADVLITENRDPALTKLFG